jgi:hypothetical protein
MPASFYRSGLDERLHRFAQSGSGPIQANFGLHAPTQLYPGFSCRKHPVFKSPECSHRDQEQVCMADEYAEKGGKGHAKKSNSMASRRESSMLCLAPDMRN